MKSHSWLPWMALGLIGWCGKASSGEEMGIRVEEQEQGWWVWEGQNRLLFYQRAPKSMKGKFERAHYVHPLYDLDGNVVTQDFPLDHFHHRGVFWAWHQVWVGDQRVGDAWMCKDFVWDVVEVKPLDLKDGTKALKTHVFWKSPSYLGKEGEMKPFVEEWSFIRVHPLEDQIRKVDFEIRLKGMEEGVRIGGSEDVKGYGGFSPRIVLPKDLVIVGRTGQLEPKTEAIEGGPWVDFTGSFGKESGMGGIAILCHPTLPQFPPPWILRRAGSMQNPVYPGREAALLPTQDPLVLRYRLALHRGNAKESRMDLLQKQYESESLPAYD